MALRRPLLLLTESKAQVGLDLALFKKHLKRDLSLLQATMRRRRDRNAGVSKEAVLSDLKAVGYPKAKKFVDQVVAGGPWVEFYDFAETLNYSDAAMDILNSLRALSTQADDDYSDEQLSLDYKKISDETASNMRAIAGLVKRAVKRIADWSGSKVTVLPDYEKGAAEATTSATVVVSNRKSRAPLKPVFTIFTQGRSFSVEDVLDAGDPEFFSKSDHSLSGDYFSLVGELRKPGSSSKKGKVVTVFTARPSNQRRIFQRAKQIPSNLFVSNDRSRVEGIASETLFSRDGQRDIYRIRINERHLTKTLDTGKIKDYQTFHRSGKVPVVEIERL